MIILEKRNGKLGAEEHLLYKAASELGIEVRYGIEKHAARGYIDVKNCAMASGNLTFVKHLLRLHRRIKPYEHTYPNVLLRFMRREILGMKSLRDVKRLLDKGGRFFVKPEDTKIFTGFVADNSYDPRFNGVSDTKFVYMVEPVKFLSEWRCYVVDGEIQAISFADGDRSIAIDRSVAEAAVSAMNKRIWRPPVGYALDFGVLDTGETALIEFNDGYALGAYDDLDYRIYWNLIYNRWQQMVV